MYEERTDNGFDEEDEKKEMDDKIEDHSITFLLLLLTLESQEKFDFVS